MITSLLTQQAPLLQGYYMDEQFGKLEGANAAIGVYYYGDYLTMQENNPDLRFAILQILFGLGSGVLGHSELLLHKYFNYMITDND